MNKIFAVRDTKADAFGSPMSVPTSGLALRSFADAVAQPDSNLNRFPEDYMLYELGSYDPNSGLLTALLPAPHLIATALSVHPKNRAVETTKAKEPA